LILHSSIMHISCNMLGSGGTPPPRSTCSNVS
jgi:hypothetical protein